MSQVWTPTVFLDTFSDVNNDKVDSSDRDDETSSKTTGEHPLDSTAGRSTLNKRGGELGVILATGLTMTAVAAVNNPSEGLPLLLSSKLG